MKITRKFLLFLKEEHPTKECETQNQTALTKEDFSLNDSAIKHFSR
ncbi:hypothetical protein MUB16_21395 [Priestia sp. OVL9]|nr:hypothetical protein [Priestia sp. OVL9]